MKITDFFSLLGGLALFLYGMQMMSNGLEAAAGNKMKQILEKLTGKPFPGSTGRSRHYCSYPVLFRHYCYGSWICKLRYDDSPAGSLDHYGCQYRYNHYRTADRSDVGAVAPLLAFLGVALVVFYQETESTSLRPDRCRPWYPVYRYGYDEFSDDAS